ncbi:PfaD family protein [Mucilaginibacter pineti]|uniref:PfaD family protein n=1 Tax=Mucilaginibacter pineti TaxID=1391627 RepID=A0A1G7P0Y7_9SPHI|nr:PfaD family polyunsaturated fatty acid/polyketide biosynthesis protein [Mucilaginibacter pineti]SDF79090.1 PfaD family protein [Mucilaginibacter pineti]
MGIGYWRKSTSDAIFGVDRIRAFLADIRLQTVIVADEKTSTVGLGQNGYFTVDKSSPQALPVLGILPGLYPEWLGDRSFQETHNLRFAYVGGAMARGIASAELVIALARIGCLGFFGSAGISLAGLQKEINTIKSGVAPDRSWGMNLIHTPNEPSLEFSIIDLYIKNEVRRIEAAAFMSLSPALVYFAFKGLRLSDDGRIIRRHFVFAKISRPEVAFHFLSPVPHNILDQLVREGRLTALEAQLAQNLPLAEDITVESDSGGHTDNRPLGPLFSAIMELRNRLSKQYGFITLPRLGAAGGLGTPNAVAAAYAMGAAYVCIGSVHQSCLESGLSVKAKKMLESAGIADCASTACADMFEQGVKVQVLRKGTMMPQRGNYLYKLYTSYPSLDALPAADVQRLEKELFRAPLANIWTDTKAFFTRTEPSQVVRAETDSKHKMALIFRWYIGKSSQWPIAGTEGRELDYQIWCGPALGAFNQWVKGTFLESIENRTIAAVALNLLEGAAITTRTQQLRTFGVDVPAAGFDYKPEILELTYD